MKKQITLSFTLSPRSIALCLGAVAAGLALLVALPAIGKSAPDEEPPKPAPKVTRGCSRSVKRMLKWASEAQEKLFEKILDKKVNDEVDKAVDDTVNNEKTLCQEQLDAEASDCARFQTEGQCKRRKKFDPNDYVSKMNAKLKERITGWKRAEEDRAKQDINTAIESEAQASEAREESEVVEGTEGN
jgi:hypothetical protein